MYLVFQDSEGKYRTVEINNGWQTFVDRSTDMVELFPGQPMKVSMAAMKAAGWVRADEAEPRTFYFPKHSGPCEPVKQGDRCGLCVQADEKSKHLQDMMYKMIDSHRASAFPMREPATIGVDSAAPGGDRVSGQLVPYICVDWTPEQFLQAIATCEGINDTYGANYWREKMGIVHPAAAEQPPPSKLAWLDNSTTFIQETMAGQLALPQGVKPYDYIYLGEKDGKPIIAPVATPEEAARLKAMPKEERAAAMGFPTITATATELRAHFGYPEPVDHTAPAPSAQPDRTEGDDMLEFFKR